MEKGGWGLSKSTQYFVILLHSVKCKILQMHCILEEHGIVVLLLYTV